MLQRMTGFDAKAGLLDYLQGARETLVWKLAGLSEYDIRRPLMPTVTNLLGLVKHQAGKIHDRHTGPFEHAPFSCLAAVLPGARTRPHASAADGRATAAAASRVAAVRETQRAAGPRAASAVMMAGEIARLKPVDS
jgi:hypothetical protein